MVLLLLWSQLHAVTLAFGSTCTFFLQMMDGADSIWKLCIENK